MTLEQIQEQMKEFAKQNGIIIDFFQSNLEGEIVDKIQECLDGTDGILINPAAYTHSSIAIRDAISAIGIPTVEVHISNIHRREEFRRTSMIAPVCAGQITGFGPFSYHLGMISIIQIITEINQQRSSEESVKS
jgi:3-dehydroquinate dehydratase-2